jgi:shikimate 5-dehydrogenase
VQYWCDEVTPSAERSGVVDTILQDETGKRIGTNTNVSGAAWAVRHLMGGTHPRRCLIAGTGASARSCVVSLRDSYGELEIGVIGRNPVRASDFAAELSVSIVEKIETYGADLVINATTVGETNDNELGFPLDKALTAGVRYFDLNNRTSTLQTQALQRGCVTLSGILMQSVVNALRAHLLARKGDRP